MTLNKVKKDKSSAKTTVAKKKSKVTNESLEPVVVQGSHLTVTTWPNGRTELKWDDEALLRDVRAAILKFESAIPVSEKKPKRKAKS